MQDLPEIAELSKNVMFAQTERGLDLAIVDQDGRAMFPEGSSRPTERTRRLLEKLAPALRQLPNRIAITGFTSTERPGRRPAAPPWELSASRAVGVRETWPARACPTTASRP